VYTSEQTFEGAHPFRASRRILTVKANGGTVTVSVKHGVEFIVAETINADTVGELNFGMATLKITPTGGAEFSVS